MLPFLQEGFMSETPQNKLADRAVRVFFLTGGDNHASCTVKAINAATGRGCYTSSVVWTTSPSGGRGQGCVASPPATAAPPTQQSISSEVVPPSPPAPCRSTGRCLFIATAVARARTCRHCRSIDRCPYIAAAAAE